MVYQWRSGARIKISAQVAGEHLEKLRNKLGKSVGPSDVLEDASDESSPLYAAFEWNDSAAAEQHRLQQARLLLNNLVVMRIKVQHPNEDLPRIITKVRAYHSVVQTDKDGHSSRGYETTARVMNSSDLRNQLLLDVYTTLESIRKKYKQLKELQGVFQAIDDFKKTIKMSKKTVRKRVIKKAKPRAVSIKRA